MRQDDITIPPTGSTGGISQYASQYGINLGPTPAGQEPEPLIYLGSHTEGFIGKRPYVGEPENMYGTGIHTTAKTSTFNELLSEFDSMSAEKQRKWALWLTLAGYAGSVDLDKVSEVAGQLSLSETINAYGSLLEDAENRYTAGQKITPTQLLNKAIDYRLGQQGIKWNGKLSSLDTDKLSSLVKEAGIGDSLSPYANKTITTTSKSVDFLNPMDAKNLVRGMLQQQLGRDPSQGEYEDFLGAVHAAEQENPSTTRTTTTYDENGSPTDTSSVTHGGMGSGAYEQMAYDRATRNPDWAEWQAMGTYAPALFSALNAPIPGV